MTVKILLTERSSGSQKSKDDLRLQEIAFKIVKARKVIAVTGAGISCNAGIPDFRSEDGLYNMVKKQYPGVVVKGKDLFDAVLFSSPDTIQVFFTFMSHLRECIVNAHSTQTHKLLRTLKDKKKLLRCYTQNIDGLERHEELTTGITQKNWRKLDVIQLHGDIHKLKCMHCSSLFEWSEENSSVCKEGEAPECPSCKSVQEDRMRRGRRNTGVGRLKPNIVLYGETHPDGDLIGRCTQADFKAKPDFLLIAGTSLKVTGIQKLVRQAAKAVRERGGIVIFVNKTEIGTSSWKDVIDYHIEADCDEWVANLKTRIPAWFAVQTSITKFTSKAAEIKNKSRSVSEKTERAVISPSTPVKQTKMRPFAAPVSQVQSVYEDTDGLLTPPPSRQRKSPRHAERKNSENLIPSAFDLLLTPEKTPSRNSAAKGFSKAISRRPLENWDHNLENGVVSRKRGCRAFDSSTIDKEFVPIKRTRNGSDLLK